MSLLASVVIPAHNEERGITRTLAALEEGLGSDRLDIVVVCNGCTDDTAALVRRSFPEVRVVDIPQPSKVEAVAVGNLATETFPRLHLDADVLVTGASVRALAEALRQPGVHAVAPTRVLDRTGCSRIVVWYYDVWERLPQVQSGLFGRGAFMVSAHGQDLVSALPALMSDDLAVSEAFAPHERRVVLGARSVVVTPRRTADLLRRRVRAVTGNAQADEAGARAESSVTRPSTLVRLALFSPFVAVRLPVFLAVTVVARIRARDAVGRGDYDTWLRDESSRA